MTKPDTAAPAPRRALLRPLAPLTYLVRNLGKTIPLAAVIMLAVLLIAGVIAMMNSIPYSIRTIYSYSKQYLGLSPRGDPTQTAVVVADVKKNSPVPLDRIVICRASASEVRSIVGKWPFIVLGLTTEDANYYLARQGSRGIDGRLPAEGAPEAVVSKPVAQNLNLRIGSILQGPELSDSYSPQNVKVVGIADCDKWLMIGSRKYQRENHFPPIDLAMVFAKNLEDQDKLDHWAAERFKGARTQVWAFFQIEKNTREMFATLYQILNVVIATLVLVITFMMGMLMNIYQSQRLVEFGLLQAIGYTKRQLLTRVIGESVAVVFIGWVVGLFAAYGLLNLAKRILMDPNAYALDVLDPNAYAYSIPVPFAILAVAISTVFLRFRKFDPVSIVERRLV